MKGPLYTERRKPEIKVSDFLKCRRLTFKSGSRAELMKGSNKREHGIAQFEPALGFWNEGRVEVATSVCLNS